jgi:hypothetical protein
LRDELADARTNLNESLRYREDDEGGVHASPQTEAGPEKVAVEIVPANGGLRTEDGGWSWPRMGDG